MDDIEKFLNGASDNEKQLLGQFVEEMAIALRKNLSTNIGDPNATVESSFTTTKPLTQQDDKTVISFNVAPSPAFDRPYTADVSCRAVDVRPCTPAERPVTAPEQQPASDDRPATAPEQRPATAQASEQPMGIPTKATIMETRKPTSARPRDRHTLFKEYMDKMSEERKTKEAAQEEETSKEAHKEARDTRSALENKYRPQSRSKEIRARTAERVQQSRQGSRQPAKFEESLRSSNDVRTQEDDECESCLRKKLINSLVEQMSDMELGKLEQIIAGDGLRPVMQGRAASAPPRPTKNPRLSMQRDSLEGNHTGANFQQVDRRDLGHFVIAPQWVSENREPTNGEVATINDLLP